METGPRLKGSTDRLVTPGIEPATPGLQGQWFIDYTTAAPCIVFKSDHKGILMANANIDALCAGSLRIKI